MTRPKFRRSLRFENLESRQLMAQGGPSAQAQYMLELINQARTSPAAAAQRVASNLTPDVQSTLQYYRVDLNAAKQAIANSTPQPPVAWNDSLASAAQGHSQDMVNGKFQSHTGSDGSSIDSRIDRSGYANRASSGENAYAYATNVDESMQAFLLDWGVSDQGHRRNLLQPNVPADKAFTDVGVGIANTNAANFGPVVVTQDFASRSNAPAQLLGVVYSDNNNDQFYEPGEGQGNVQIDATNLATGENSSTTTWDSGGYQMPLAPGNYQVTASVNDKVIQTTNVNIGRQNVKQDFVVSNRWDGRSRSQVVGSAAARLRVNVPVSTPTPTATPNSTPAPTPTPTVSTFKASVAPKSNQDSSPLGSWTAWKANRA